MRQVGRCELGLQIKNSESPLQTAHIELGFTQCTQEGYAKRLGPVVQRLGGVGPAVNAHAHHRQPATAARHAGHGHQLGVAGLGRLTIEHRIADWHHDAVCKHDHPRQLKAVHAARRIQHHVGDAGRDAKHVFLIHGPGGDGG